MERYLLKTDAAVRLYQDYAKNLPIIDLHNHLSHSHIAENHRFESLTELWLASDPYKHRLMRIMGVDEHFITGDADPNEKFQKFCQVFPLLAGNPVYDWARMELFQVFGISALPCADNAKEIYDQTGEMLKSEEYSFLGLLKRFHVEYHAPVAALTDDLSPFDGKTSAPSLRGDDLLALSAALFTKLGEKTGKRVTDKASYFSAIQALLDRFLACGCAVADHALDSDFFTAPDYAERKEILLFLAKEYAKRNFTLLLHMGAKRKTSTRLRSLAGPAGGYAAAGNSFDTDALCDLLDEMEQSQGLPDTVLFPLNLADAPKTAVLQGSFSADGIRSKVQLGPAWWWCDHPFGIKQVLDSVASFGVLSTFIGMTTDSRSPLSFVRHDYFRRLLCDYIERKCREEEWGACLATQGRIIQNICYQNAKEKIDRAIKTKGYGS